MYYREISDSYIMEFTPFVIDGQQYPANWLVNASEDDKDNLGIREVYTSNQPADPKFYWVSETLVKNVRTYTNAPKDVNQVKEVLISELSTKAYTLLSPSDYRVLKSAESGIPLPEVWSTYRSAVRSEVARVEALIAAAQTVEELILIEAVWPTQP